MYALISIEFKNEFYIEQTLFDHAHYPTVNTFVLNYVCLNDRLAIPFLTVKKQSCPYQINLNFRRALTSADVWAANATPTLDNEVSLFQQP